MDYTFTFLAVNKSYVVSGLVILLTCILIVVRYLRKSKPRICGVDYPKDTVILHQYQRGKYAPNMGHFVMKLETFLRVHKIPYQSDFNYRNGPKGKTPWIEYNGIVLGDSQMIIDFLNKEFKINMDDHLDKKSGAHAWAIQKWIEEYTYWLNVHIRWVILIDDMYNEDISVFSRRFKSVIRKRAKNLTYYVGIGRHSNEEVYSLMIKDLRIFSELLDDHKFLMGDKMAVVDCAAFGILSQIYYNTPSSCPGRQLLEGDEIPNVKQYIQRIRDLYWPDWDKLKPQ